MYMYTVSYSEFDQILVTGLYPAPMMGKCTPLGVFSSILININNLLVTSTWRTFDGLWHQEEQCDNALTRQKRSNEARQTSREHEDAERSPKLFGTDDGFDDDGRGADVDSTEDPNEQSDDNEPAVLVWHAEQHYRQTPADIADREE